MSDEQVAQIPAGEIPVATPESTAGSDTASEQIVSEDQQPEEKAEKTFTQQELDEIIAKRIAKAERKAQREADRRIAQAIQEAQPKQQTEAPAGRPKPENFTSTEDYIEAVSDWKAGERIRAEFDARETAQNEARARQEVSEIQSTYQGKEDDAREKYDDFDKVAYQTPYECTPAMAQAIQLSDVGPDLAYFLGKHPDEASRIAKLHPLRAAQELGKLELKISDSPVVKTSSAPSPIKPVNAKSDHPVRDTTDPRSDKLSAQEWIRLENERERKKLAARGFR